jgi:hypothetical protein
MLTWQYLNIFASTWKKFSGMHAKASHYKLHTYKYANTVSSTRQGVKSINTSAEDNAETTTKGNTARAIIADA